MAKKVMSLQEIEEITDYYKYYGETTKKEYRAADIVAIGTECLRLRELLEQILKTTNVKDAKEIAKQGLIESIKY